MTISVIDVISLNKWKPIVKPIANAAVSVDGNIIGYTDLNGKIKHKFEKQGSFRISAIKIIKIGKRPIIYSGYCNIVVNSFFEHEKKERVTESATTPTPTPEEKEGTPGFEALFAITGLLAVAYLLRRRE